MQPSAKFLHQPPQLPPHSIPGLPEVFSSWGFTNATLRLVAPLAHQEVIDGRALRHAFESLDDDGSEFISPED